jgi:tripartite-type tricarboxylate transporter receptor subunit TctC
MKHSLILGSLLMACCQPVSAAAPDFPTRPVRIVTPYAPGAGTDIVARALAKDFTEAFGKQVIVDNRPGGTGTIGALTVVNATPDGHTLFLGTSAVMVTNPVTSSKISYDPQRDFAAIGRATVLPPILVSHPSLPVKNFKDVIAIAKAKPGQLNFASSGQGSPHHLALELLKSLTGIDVVHVPYKGGAPAIVDTLAGQVQLSFSSVPTVMPHIKSGKLRALAVGSAKRSVVVPDVPTITESGVAGFDYNVWYGLFGPAKVPAPVISKISAQLKTSLSVPEISKYLLVQGAEPGYLTPDETRAYIKSETARWSAIVKERNLKLD